MNSLVLEALVLGLIGGAIPGPILTGSFTEILSSGFWAGLRVILIAFAVETIGALIAIYAIYSLGLSDLAIKLISLAGAIVLIWLAWSIWQIKNMSPDNARILTFLKIAGLTALNSGYWVFWLTIGIPRALELNHKFIGGRFIFLGVFEIGWLIAAIILALIFSQFRPFLYKKNLVGTVFKALSLMLVWMAIKTLISSF